MWVICQSSHNYKINSVIIKRVKCQSSHIYKINSVISKRVKCQSSHIYKINSVISKRVKCQSSHIYKINSVIIKNAIILNIIHDISNLWDTYTYEYYHLKDINDNTPYFKASIYNASILENATSGKIINIMIVIYPFFFWSLCCLSFNDSRLLVIPLVSSHFS
jgi:hypothetical protein